MFQALPYPLQPGHCEALIKVGKAAVQASRAVYMVKESGDEEKISAANAAYKQASEAVEITESMIRNSIGLTHTRPEFLHGENK